LIHGIMFKHKSTSGE